MDIDDRFVLGLIGMATVAIVVASLIYVVVPRSVEHHDRAKAVAESMGCELVGSVEHLNTIKYIECNGEIRMIRVK